MADILLFEKDYTSFEYALALKKAGFPQPAIAYHWLTWFDQSGERWMPGSIKLNPDIYAPSATNILKEFKIRFGGDLILSFNRISQVWNAEDLTDSLVDENGKLIMGEDKDANDLLAKLFLSNPRPR